MKKKIAYLTLTAVIGVTAFFVGKNFTTTTTAGNNPGGNNPDSAGTSRNDS